MKDRPILICALAVLLLSAFAVLGLARDNKPNQTAMTAIADANGGLWLIDGAGNVSFKQRPVKEAAKGVVKNNL